MKRKRFLALILSGLLAVTCTVPVGAAEVGVMLNSDMDAETESEGEISADMHFSLFLEELRNAYEERQNAIEEMKWTTELEERDFYLQIRDLAVQEYKNLKEYDTEFTDADQSDTPELKNQEYLRKAYMEGLKKQKNASCIDGEAFYKNWNEGCLERSRVLAEIFCEYPNMASDDWKRFYELAEIGVPVEEETYWAYFIQQFLQSEGCDIEVDGKIGFATIYYLKTYQNENAQSLGGIVNETLVRSLSLDEETFNQIDEQISKYTSERKNYESLYTGEISDVYNAGDENYESESDERVPDSVEADDFEGN